MPEASEFRIAAAVGLLLIAGGVWWKIQSTPVQMAANQVVNKPKNRFVLQEKQMVLAAKKDVLKEEATYKKQVSLKKQSKEIPTERNFVKVEIQAPIVVNSELENNVGNDWPAPADRSGVSNLADVSEAPKNRAKQPSEIAEVVTVPDNPTPQSTAKTTLKPKFKIVHANELTDYQRVELAEAKEKEAKAKGFIVINWHTNANNQPENGIMSYLKKKNVTTPAVIVE